MTRPAAAAAEAGGQGTLARGMLIDASVVARLLKIRLLTLEARVTVLPARPLPSAPGTPGGAGARGRTLGRAMRALDEGADSLAQARRNRAQLASRPARRR